MNIRTLLLTFTTALALVACTDSKTAETGEAGEAAAASVAAINYTIDHAASNLVWTGRNVVVGKAHTGTINISAGTLSVEGDAITAGDFVIDMNSITNTDIENPEYNAKLVGHLKDTSFFAVTDYPTASFVVTGVEAVTGQEGITHHVSGNLTLRGVTKEVKIPANVSITEGAVNATADFVIDRSLWEVKYGSGSFFEGLGDDLIEDNIELNLTLAATPAGDATASAE